MSTAAPEAQSVGEVERRFVLPGVGWKAYRKISDALTERHVRLSYDCGRFEFTTISLKHDNICRLIDRLVVTLAEELERPVRGFGDMTCDRTDFEKGVELDEPFFIDNEPLIRGKDEFDFAVDPPPDLGIEVDITSSSRIRIGVYGALGAPEIWRYAKDRVAILVRQDDGTYLESEFSQTFAFVAAADLTRFVEMRQTHDETSLIRGFREWVREKSV